MNRISAPIVLALLFSTLFLPAEDWPTYRRDRLRRAITPEKLQLPLKQLWAFKSRQSKQAPVPTRDPTRAGFPECSKYNLPIISAGDSVYFTSSVEGRVVSLDAATAKKNWEYFSGAGIYRTPMFWEGKLYFGSEDGWAYCLEAKTGRLIWKFQAAPATRQFLSYGKMISVWPVRTDVLVDKGEAYFSAGVFPHEGTYVYTLDANTGKLKWRNDTQSEDSGQSNLAPGGHLMVTRDQIWVPKDFRGYSNMPYGAPTSFRRKDGLFTHWPDPNDPEAPKIDSNSPWTRIFWPLFGVERDGVRYAGSTAWETKNEHLSRKGVWSAETPGRWTDYDSGVGTRMKAGYGYPVIFRYDPDHAAVVMAGDVLFHTSFDSDPKKGVGSGIYARNYKDGKLLWSFDVPERANQLVVANGRLFVGTRRGTIYAFSAAGDGPGEIVEKVAEKPEGLDGSMASAADVIVRESGIKDGYGLVIDCKDGQLPLELARRTNLELCAVFEDEAAMMKARRMYAQAGLNVRRIASWLRPEGEKLPYPSFFADLIVSEAAVSGGALPKDTEDWSRLLKPIRGVAMMGGAHEKRDLEDWSGVTGQEGWKVVSSGGHWAHRLRPPLKNGGGWTQMHGDPGNTSCSQDLVLKAPLGVLWYGTPTIKVPGKHTSLIKNGILVVPEPHSLQGCDQYTGRHLWKLDAANIGANLGVSDTHVYARYGKVLLQINLLTGKHEKSFLTPFGKDVDWGWFAVAQDEKTVYGAAANGLFATEMASGKGNVRWQLGGPKAPEDQRVGGTMAMSDGLIFALGGKVSEEMRADAISQMRIYFQTQSPELLKEFEGQVKERDIQQLTTIDAKTGKILYRTGVDISNCGGKWMRSAGFGGKRHYNPYVFLDVYARNGVFVIGSASRADKGWGVWNGGGYKVRALTAYDGKTGDLLWYKFTNHRTRPVIVGDTIHAEPWAFDLRTGKKKTRLHPITGQEADWAWCRFDKQCGVFSASGNLLFGRNKGFGYKDLQNDEGIYTFWHSRSNCYVDHVSGGGLMIKPPQAIYCKCMWSLPFTVAMGEVATLTSSAPKFAQPGPSLPVKHLNVDFGSNGDRKDDKGQLWISSTNRIMNHKLLLHYGIKLMMYDGWQDARRSARFTKTAKADVPFVFASSLTGLKSCILPVAKPEHGTGTYKVRLGFAAPPGETSGKRIFDVRLNGRKVLENFDIASEAGGAEIAVWKEFSMELKENLVIELVSASGTPTYEQLPLLNGVQILRQEMRGGGLVVSGEAWVNIEKPEKELSIKIGNSRPETLKARLVLEAPGGLEVLAAEGGKVTIPAFSSADAKVTIKGKPGLGLGIHQVGLKLVGEDGKVQFQRKIPVEWLGKFSREIVRGNTRTILGESLQRSWGSRLRPHNLRNEFMYVCAPRKNKPADGAASYVWFHVPGHLRANTAIRSARIQLREAREFSLLNASHGAGDAGGKVTGSVRRIEGPPWPDFNKVKYPDLPKAVAGATRFVRSGLNPAAVQAELPGGWKVDPNDGNMYFVLDAGRPQGAAYWSSSVSRRELAPVLVIDYEKKESAGK